MNNQAIGIIALIVGAGLLFWGYQESQSYGNQFSRALTNKFDTTTMVLFIAGAACCGFGAFSLFRK